MLLLIISATYAYFSVTINGNGSKSMITANTPKKHSLSVSTLYDDIHIHVDNNDMKLANVGSYYGSVDKDNRYETDLTTGTHQIIEVSSKGMENIRYSCSGDIKVTLETKDGSMGSVLEKEDVLLYLKGLGLDETLDLSILKTSNTKIYNTSFEIDGDSSDYLSAIVELVNKPSYQNYIANKILNVKIEAENMVCHENGTYKYLVKLNKTVKEMQDGKETSKTVSIFYDEEGLYQKIQNVYLVDYIDTSKAIKTWELGDTSKGTKSDEVMGWLEATPNENDRYDLYIGSNGPMRAPQDMRYAFYQFTNLKKISGNALDTSEVTSMNNLFCQDTNLIDISALSGWDVSKVTNMESVFSYCNKLSDISPLTNWNVSKVTTMSSMFRGIPIYDLSPLNNWDTSNVTTFNAIFKNTKVSNLTPLKNWNISQAKNIGSMFSYTLIDDLAPISNWDISNNVIDMNNLFTSCANLTDISALVNWDVSKVTNIGGLFNSCTNLTDISSMKNWNVSNVTAMYNVFSNTPISDLTPIINWQVSKVTNMGGMFSSCRNLKDLTPLKDWDVSSVTNMSYMFSETTMDNITPLSTWDVSKVKNMSWMFYRANINDFKGLAGWNIKNDVNLSLMFYQSSINDISSLSEWDVSKVTNIGGMFSGCRNLADLSPIVNWDVSSVTNMAGMFESCSNLTKVDLSNWQTPKLENVSKFFSGATKLSELRLPKASYNTITNIDYYEAMFGGKYKNTIHGTVSSDIKIYTESSQVDWVEARLQEALGENNNSTVIAY